MDWENYKKGFGNLEKDFWIGKLKYFCSCSRAIKKRKSKNGNGKNDTGKMEAGINGNGKMLTEKMATLKMLIKDLILVLRFI